MAREAWLHFLFIVTWKTRMESVWQSSITTVRAGHMCLVRNVFVIFTIQERVCLSWPVSPVSPHTVSSLLSTSVMTRVYTFAIQLHGGCHVILLRWRIGGGAWPGSGKCACGMSNSCADSRFGCNCDKDDYVWREDSGLLTDKTTLPVTQLYIGDVGGPKEKGYYTLGKLKCYGIAWTCFILNLFSQNDWNRKSLDVKYLWHVGETILF